MKIFKLLLPVAMLLATCVACVPQDEFDLKVNELDKANAHVSELESANSQLDGDLTRCGSERSACQDENALMLERLNRSGTNMSQLENELEQTRDQLAELERARNAAERRNREYQQLMDRFRNLIDAGRLSVVVIDGRIVVQIPNSILFSSGSYELSEEGIASIQEITEVLKTIENRTFQVTGHTDNVPVKPKPDSKYTTNWQLSCFRALSVLDVMVGADMQGDRVSAAGYGEFSPVARNNTAANRAKNRRTEIVLMPDVSDLPTFTDQEE
jgi:chemotaxis protein MotB